MTNSCASKCLETLCAYRPMLPGKAHRWLAHSRIDVCDHGLGCRIVPIPATIGIYRTHTLRWVDGRPDFMFFRPPLEHLGTSALATSTRSLRSIRNTHRRSLLNGDGVNDLLSIACRLSSSVLRQGPLGNTVYETLPRPSLGRGAADGTLARKGSLIWSLMRRRQGSGKVRSGGAPSPVNVDVPPTPCSGTPHYLASMWRCATAGSFRAVVVPRLAGASRPPVDNTTLLAQAHPSA